MLGMYLQPVQDISQRTRFSEQLQKQALQVEVNYLPPLDHLSSLLLSLWE